MTDEPDLLADLGLKACPARARSRWSPAGDLVERETAHGRVVHGSVWWTCPHYGITALA